LFGDRDTGPVASIAGLTGHDRNPDRLSSVRAPQSDSPRHLPPPRLRRQPGGLRRSLTRPGEDPAPSADTSCTLVSATLRMSKLLASLMMRGSRASSTSAPEHQLTVINGPMLAADYEEKPVTRNPFSGSGKSSWPIRNLAAHRPARYQPRRSVGKASIRPPRRRSTGRAVRDRPSSGRRAPGPGRPGRRRSWAVRTSCAHRSTTRPASLQVPGCRDPFRMPSARPTMSQDGIVLLTQLPDHPRKLGVLRLQLRDRRIPAGQQGQQIFA